MSLFSLVIRGQITCRRCLQYICLPMLSGLSLSLSDSTIHAALVALPHSDSVNLSKLCETHYSWRFEGSKKYLNQRHGDSAVSRKRM